jgi:ribosomal protein S18 acetylase RimI-like enzyme
VLSKPAVIRALRAEDLAVFRPVRLRALRDHPTAFGSSVEEEAQADLLRLIGTPPSVTIGAFSNDDLIGIGALVVSSRIKRRHTAEIVSLYVMPEFRGQGVARELMQALLDRARTAGLSVVTLTVTAGNEAARALYLALGFISFGVTPDALQIDGRLLNEEQFALRLIR